MEQLWFDEGDGSLRSVTHVDVLGSTTQSGERATLACDHLLIVTDRTVDVVGGRRLQKTANTYILTV